MIFLGKPLQLQFSNLKRQCIHQLVFPTIGSDNQRALEPIVLDEIPLKSNSHYQFIIIWHRLPLSIINLQDNIDSIHYEFGYSNAPKRDCVPNKNNTRHLWICLHEDSQPIARVSCNHLRQVCINFGAFRQRKI